MTCSYFPTNVSHIFGYIVANHELYLVSEFGEPLKLDNSPLKDIVCAFVSYLARISTNLLKKNGVKYALKIQVYSKVLVHSELLVAWFVKSADCSLNTINVRCTTEILCR